MIDIYVKQENTYDPPSNIRMKRDGREIDWQRDVAKWMGPWKWWTDCDAVNHAQHIARPGEKIFMHGLVTAV